MKALTCLAMAVLLLLIVSCGLSNAPSSVGLYRDLPGPQPVKGSSNQVMDTRTVNYNSEEVVEAITKSFNMMGLDFQDKNAKKGLYTGSGNWNAPGQVTTCVTPYTFAAYVQQINNKPSTKIIVLIDRHSMCGSALSPERVLMSHVMGNFAKVLSTF